MDPKIVLQIIYDTFTEINLDLPVDQHLTPTPETVLGLGGGVDSLTLINILVGVEQRVEKQFGRSLRLLEDPAVLDDRGPLQTAGTLAAFIRRELETTAA